MKKQPSPGFVRLQRPWGVHVVDLSRYEWRRLLDLARMYGWKGTDAARWSAAESADFAAALERARIPAQLQPIASQLMPVVRAGGIELLRAN